MNALWPYGLPAALLAIPVVWLLVILILSVTGRLTGWPPPELRPLIMYVTLAVSLVPLALRLLDMVSGRWGADADDEQGQTLAEIHINRANYEDMAARTPGPPPPAVAQVLARFDQLVAEAKATKDSNALAALLEESEMLAQRRAFICPKEHIVTEARSHLFSMADWGLPTKTLEALKEAAAAALDVKDVDAARGALHVIFEEYDRWSDYLGEYNENTSFWASTSLGLIAVLTTAALFMMFGWSWRVLALVCAAVAGAAASVIARLPGLTSYGEWRVNLRAYQARLGTGIVGSLVGIGLLGSGMITIPLPSPWKSADALLHACLDPCVTGDCPTPVTPPPAGDTSAATAPARCQGGGILFVLAVTMLLGFSERVLTSLENRVTTPAPAASSAPARG